MIHFLAHGTPATKGSARHIGGGRIINDAGPKAKAWQQVVTYRAREAAKGRPIAGPVSVLLRFYLPAPKRNTRARPHVRPDVDKLARLVLDGLTGAAYSDDGQVVELVAEKHYAAGRPVGVEVRVMEISP